MRWQYCAQPPTQNLLFGFGPGHEIQRKLLTLWNSASFFVQYANIAGFTPGYARPRRRGPRSSSTTRPLAGRPHAPARGRGHGGLRAVPHRQRAPRVRGATSTTSPTGTSAARAAASGTATTAALRTLWSCLVNGAARRRAGDAVPHRAPLAARSWREPLPDAPAVDLPRRLARRRRRPTRRCSTTMAAVRQVVELGRQARAASKLRDPPAAAPPRRRGRRPGRGARRRRSPRSCA